MINISTDITIESDHWSDESKLNKLAQDVLDATFKKLSTDVIQSELSLVFTDDANICKINAEWRHINKATNVLSFPAFPIDVGQKPGPMLGDIIIAFETVQREALLEGKNFEHHLTHLMVHGLLHLLGYDHEDDEDANLMEQLERDILQSLAIDDPYFVALDKYE